MNDITTENISIVLYGQFQWNRIFIFLIEGVGIVYSIVFHNIHEMNNTHAIGFDEEFCPLPLNVMQQL